MNIQFYLNDVAVDAPANWQSLLIELNFDSSRTKFLNVEPID